LRIVYYTSGFPGIGRIVRGIAIRNGLLRRGTHCDYTILSSNPLAKIADTFDIPHIEIPLEDESVFTRENYPDSLLYRTLSTINPSILIVDRVWFPLYHFIDDLRCKKIFLTLQVSDNFFKVSLNNELLSFRNEQYDQVLAIEPFESSVEMDQINPIIIRNRDEIYCRESALEKLGLSGDKKVCLIALNYKEGYFERLKDKYSYLKGEGHELIYTTNLRGGGIFPIVDYYNAIDLIICAAGYNQFWEVIYFNKEAVFENVPLKFSSTERRIKECQECYFDENGADQLVDIMMNL
jgi:hypothetical protein